MTTPPEGNGLLPGVSRPGRPDLGWPELAATAVLVVLFSVTAGIGWVTWEAVAGAPEPLIVWLLLGAVAVAPLVAWSIRVRDLGAIGVRSAARRPVLVGAGAGAVLGALAGAGERAVAAATGVATSGMQAWAGAPEVLGVGTLLLLVLVAPLVYELLFRGMIYGALRRYGAVVALTGSTLLWTALSVSGAVGDPGVVVAVYGVAALALGVLTGLLYERSASLWPPVAAATTFGAVGLLWGLLW